MKTTLSDGRDFEGTLDEYEALESRIISTKVKPKATGNNSESALDYSKMSPDAIKSMCLHVLHDYRINGKLDTYKLLFLKLAKGRNGVKGIDYWTEERLAELYTSDFVSGLAYGIAKNGWDKSTAKTIFMAYRKLATSIVREPIASPLIVASAELPMKVKKTA